MSNNKQTSVDWLFQQLWETPKDKFTWHSILEEAKAMEKQQMKDAVLEQSTKHERLRKIFEKQFEEYYNETYGK